MTSLESISIELINQRIHHDDYVTLQEEILKLHCETPLWMTRKHLPDGPTKTPILLVHGFAQNRFSWHNSIRSMSAWLAQQGHDVYNLELRGHGKSRESASTGGFQDYIEDVIAVANALPEPAFWIGHSLGGGVLYGAAATMRPLRCRGVIGMGAVFHFGSNNPAMRMLCSITRRLTTIPVFNNVRFHTKPSGNFFNHIFTVTNNIGYILPVSGWWPNTVEEALVKERLEKGFDWLSVPIWKDMCFIAKNKRFIYEQEWSETDIPVLVLLGDRDHFLWPRDGKPAYNLSPSKYRKMVVFDDYHHQHHWGHLDLVLGKDAPTYVWPTITNWITSIEVAS
jgi:polyhydroxyalkanoate synthase subunit PhaC